MSAPTWITPAGFIGTLTEKITTSTVISASGGNVTYSLLSGNLPSGLIFYNTGTIAGTPYSVGDTIRSQFVVRATNPSGVKDRTFYLDVSGPTGPQWVTPSGFVEIGFSEQFYAINKQYVDYQFSADYDKLPSGQKLRYFIEDGDGSLPRGLELTEDGRLYGQIKEILRLSYKRSATAGYDEETYDDYPYDHAVIFNSEYESGVRFIGKTFQFYITATDGVSNSKRLFKIRVEDPSSLRVDNTYIHSDTEQYLSDAGFLLSPQWLTPVNLGYVRANNKQVIHLSIYDFDPGKGSIRYDWLTPTINQDGTPSIRPQYFELDTATGNLYATIPYQPAWSIAYKFTIWVIKTDFQTKEDTVSARTFTLTVRGDVESVIEWVTDPFVGALAPGFTSELSIVAQHIGANYSVEYQLIDRALPSGLTLNVDGTISGEIDYDTGVTTFDVHSVISSGYILDRSSNAREGAFLLDGGTTTIDKKVYFTVRASDIYQQSSIEREFYIEVLDNALPGKYTKIYVEPSLSLAQRDEYRIFINDSFTFDRSLIYRKDDPNFGIQQKLKVFLEHGIQQIKLADYTDALRQYFYRKKFYFGEVKWIKATDDDENYVYDLVYVEIKDPLETGKSVTEGTRTVGDVTVYPNSVVNMKNALEAIQIEGTKVKTDEYLLPKFMRTIQSDGSPLGFILAAPLCYALPGKGDTIVKRIKLATLDFRTIDFDVDKLIVKENLSEAGAKYLRFPRATVNGVNLGESVSYITTPEGLGLETEDGLPLYVEL